MTSTLQYKKQTDVSIKLLQILHIIVSCIYIYIYIGGYVLLHTRT